MADVDMHSGSSSSSEDEDDATEVLMLQAKAMAMLDLLDDGHHDYLAKNRTVRDIARAAGFTLSRAPKIRKDSSISEWAEMLKDPALLIYGSRAYTDFRRRYRIPYELFLQLCNDAEREQWVPCGVCDAAGEPSHPLRLKILGALRCLGRDECSDTTEEMSKIGPRTQDKFTIAFLSALVKHRFDSWVCLPTGKDLAFIMKVYETMGFPGAIGSFDCVHFAWGRCPAGLQSACDNGKQDGPTLSFLMCADHTRKILNCSGAFTGTTNDKTISLFSDFMGKLRQGTLVEGGVQYQLRTEEGFTTHTAPWCIVDNGFHKWWCLQGPDRHTDYQSALHDWCTHLESVRKDVECTFG
jgi:hypothetical protein